MTTQLRAHFDGRVIVPDEPLDVPVNQPLSVQLTLWPNVRLDQPAVDAAFERLLARAVSASPIPTASLQRESLYQDR